MALGPLQQSRDKKVWKFFCPTLHIHILCLRQAGRRCNVFYVSVRLSVRSSVRSFIWYQTCEYDILTRNASVDEIGERYRLNHAIDVKLLPPLYLISSQLSPISSVDCDFFWRIVSFLLLCLLLTYLLIIQFLVDNYLWQFCGIRPLMQGLECYYDIIKRTAELKSDNG